MRRLTVFCLALAAAAALTPVAIGAAEEAPRLGAKAFAAPYGDGFGAVRPSDIFNGGDPSGHVFDIVWKSWGESVAIGHGRNPTFKPHGGYYRRPARIKLRAERLGRCGGHRAYTRLSFRAPRRPGGPLGPWMPWSGASSICSSPY